jgi:DNA-binding response OmpR family regulator
MKLLFVENHERFISIVTKQFLAEHDVTVVPTIAQAWSELAETEYDVVLVDYDLDDGKGDELVKKIRRASMPVKIIAVSSHDRGNNALLSAGADVICGKIQFAEISTVLNSLMSN